MHAIFTSPNERHGPEPLERRGNHIAVPWSWPNEPKSAARLSFCNSISSAARLTPTLSVRVSSRPKFEVLFLITRRLWKHTHKHQYPTI